MELLRSIVLFVHLGAALLIIALVLLQRGKGADAGTGFGAGASGTVFGARGSASFLTRATAVLAAVFFATSLTLVYFANQDTTTDSLSDSLTTQGSGSTEGSTVLEGEPEDLVPRIAPPDPEDDD